MLHPQKPPENEKCPVCSQSFPSRMFAAHVTACRFENKDEVSITTHNTKIRMMTHCVAQSCAIYLNSTIYNLHDIFSSNIAVVVIPVISEHKNAI